MTDEGLVERARRGDLTAFNQLVRRHYPSIFEVARRLSPCPDDAADVAQEVLVRRRGTAAIERLARHSITGNAAGS